MAKDNRSHIPRVGSKVRVKATGETGEIAQRTLPKVTLSMDKGSSAWHTMEELEVLSIPELTY